MSKMTNLIYPTNFREIRIKIPNREYASKKEGRNYSNLNEIKIEKW